MSTILVVEDDTRIASLIRRGMEEDGYPTLVAYDASMALKLLTQGGVVLMITDIILPGSNGIDLCKTVKQTYPSLPVIMLTALGTTDDKIEGFDAGADDYLVKPFDLRELLARVKVLLRRQMALRAMPQGNTLTYADLEINNLEKTVKRAGQVICLTPKEFKLLCYMVKHAERVLTRTEIAENVWDMHFDTGTNFIDVYINYLRKKIDKPFSDPLIHTKTGMGFILKKGHDQK